MPLGLRQPATPLSRPLSRLLLLPLVMLLPLLAFTRSPGVAAAPLTDDDLRRLATLLRSVYGEERSSLGSGNQYYDYYGAMYGEEGDDEASEGGDDTDAADAADFAMYDFDEPTQGDELLLRPHSANKRLLAMRMGKRFSTGGGGQRANWWWPHSGAEYPEERAAAAAGARGAHVTEKKQKFNMLRMG